MKALALILFLISPQAQANKCIELFKNNRLTSQQLYWLDIAESSDYSVTQLKSPQGQNVVLMGESHLKDLKASIVGQRILLEFPYRAHELASTEKTWGGEFFSIYLDSAFNFIQTTTNRTYRSTINDAQSTTAEIISTVKVLEEAVAKVEDSKQQGSFERPYLEKNQYDYKNFFLENNHKPDLKENLFSIIVPTEYLSKVLLIPVAAISWMAPNSFVAELVFPAVLIVVGGRVVHKYLAKKLKNKYSDRTWYNKVFFDDLGVLEARNKTKSKNINKILNENPEIKTLLVIVGKLHIEGIVENLMQNGYEAELK